MEGGDGHILVVKISSTRPDPSIGVGVTESRINPHSGGPRGRLNRAVYHITVFTRHEMFPCPPPQPDRCNSSVH